MAVIVVSDQGRVTHWSRVADELFGLDPGQAIGRTLRTLLHLPQEHQEAFEPSMGRISHVWTGICMVPRVGDGELREIAWWVYPLNGPGKARVLAIAADAQRLRDQGPGLALGDALVLPPPARPLTSESGLRMLRVEPSLVRVTECEATLLSRRLSELLPLMGPEASERIVRQVLSQGYPAVNLSVTVRLPFTPYWGAMPRVRRIRPGQDTVRPDGAGPAERPQAGRPGLAAVSRDGVEARELSVARERLTLLGEAGSSIGEALEPALTGAELAEALVPAFCDFAAVTLLQDIVDGSQFPSGAPPEPASVVRVAVRHDDEPGRWDDVVPEGELLRLPSATPFMRSMRTGRSINIARVNPKVSERISAQFGDRDLRPLLENRSLLIVPLVARGSVFGDLVMLRRADRPPFDDMDVTLAEELCRRAAVCIDNGRLYHREARTAARLQDSMLPAAPPEVAGAQVRYRFLPASRGSTVGGDWFDAIPLPGGKLALVIGDVMGHGLTCAAIMGQLRTAVRTLALQDPQPGQLLRQLDDLAQRLGEDCIATCLYAVYDPVARRCEMANAGHLPPLLVSPEGDCTRLLPPPGAPIGVGGVAFETIGFDVADGSRLVMCTDGLIEARDRDLDHGLEMLSELLSGPPRSLDCTCEAVLSALCPPDRADDVALLAASFEGIPAADVVAWTIASEPGNVRQMRTRTCEALDRWGLAGISENVELLVSELVTNAMRHGAGDVRLRLIRANALLCEVSDDGNDLPYLCHADVTDEGGRGLQLVSYLADHWGTHRTPTGKVVWFEHALPVS